MIKTDDRWEAIWDTITELSDTADCLEGEIKDTDCSKLPVTGVAVALDHVAQALLLQAGIELCRLRLQSG